MGRLFAWLAFVARSSHIGKHQFNVVVVGGFSVLSSAVLSTNSPEEEVGEEEQQGV